MSNSRGTVEKRNDTWSYRFSYRDSGGVRRDRRKQGFATKLEAQQAMTIAMAKTDAGRGHITDRTLTGDYVEAWLHRWVRSGKPKNTTAQTAATHVRCYIVPFIGDVAFGKLTATTLSDWLDKLATEGRTGKNGHGGLSSKTVRNVAGTLHKAFADGVRRNELSRNPLEGVDLPKAERGELVTWDARQVNQFLEYSRSHGDYCYPIWRLLFSTGLRRGELCGLRWNDIDLISGTVNVVQAIVEVNGRTEISTPKTKAGRRTIRIDVDTCVVLAHLKNCQESAAEHLGGWTSDRVATHLDGRPMYPRSLLRTFQNMTKASGLPKTRLHDGRHAYVGLALSAGTPIHVVSGRVGHAKVSTTYDVYSHFLPTADSHAADTIGQVLRSSSHDGEWTPMDTTWTPTGQSGHQMDTIFGGIGHTTTNHDEQSSDSNPMSDDESGITRNATLEATLGIEGGKVRTNALRSKPFTALWTPTGHQ